MFYWNFNKLAVLGASPNKNHNKLMKTLNCTANKSVPRYIDVIQ